MIFVDGENLAIRYGNLVKNGRQPQQETLCEKDVWVWSKRLNPQPTSGTPAVLRKYYYTALQGDEQKISGATTALKKLGIEAPRVFKKEKSKGSKQVDITLATEMIVHACRKHYDLAVLVAGDEDYIPLVQAVQKEGAVVYLWFISDGLSPKLERAADIYMNIDQYLLT
jgi:uncharacterized LabA/DUF88 family protein